ncbi:MAG TPA: VapE domain-containing protein [Polyangiaceae bacterium]
MYSQVSSSTEDPKPSAYERVRDSASIFPLHPIVDGRCGCSKSNCEDAGKHPLLSGWRSLGPGEKWGIPPSHGAGIATGLPSGVFVVDLDRKNGIDGVAALASLGPVPDTFTVQTGSGGFHLYFQLPDFPVKNSQGSKGGLAPGIDIRGDGGYVVAPGSPHKSGGTYEVFADLPVAVAPQWLLDWPGLRGTVRNATEAGANAPVPVDVSTEEGQRRIRLAREYLVEAPIAISGQGGHLTLFKVALHLVRRLELPLNTAFELLKEPGGWNDRCEPDWKDPQIWYKLEEARDESELPTGVAPEGWSETVERLCNPRREQDAVLARVAQSSDGPKRRVRNPGHWYSFTPGDMPPGDTKKTTLGKVIAELSHAQEWSGVLQFDEFAERVIAVNPPLRLDAENELGAGLSDSDSDAISAWFEVNRSNTVSGEIVYKASIQAARRNSFHPVREYLESCRAARVPGILGNLAERLFGVPDQIAQEMLAKSLVAAVRRVLRPGLKHDHMLVLKGPQGAFKSSFVTALFGEQWTQTQMPDLKGKDASEALKGKWAVEIGELAGLSNAEDHDVKAFLTRQIDDYRPSYGRANVRRARQCVFIGTCNEGAFLKDPTGGRRYWPIELQRVNLDLVRRLRDSIWGEALHLAELPTSTERPDLAGTDAVFDHWFADESEANRVREDFARNDPWHDEITFYITGRSFVQVRDVYLHLAGRVQFSDLPADLRGFGKAEEKRIRDTLVRLGCTSGRTKAARGYDVPKQLAHRLPERVTLVTLPPSPEASPASPEASPASPGVTKACPETENEEEASVARAKVTVPAPSR